MFITITRSGHIELQDAANFRAFKVLDRSGKSTVELVAALEGFATLTPDGTAAWVDASAVPKLLPHCANCGMADLVQRHGCGS
jgi:hypothetical protein